MGKFPLDLAGGHGASLDIDSNNCLHWVILYQTANCCVTQKGIQRVAALVPNVRDGLVAIDHLYYSSPRKIQDSPSKPHCLHQETPRRRKGEPLPNATKVTAGTWHGRDRKAGVSCLPPQALGITRLPPSTSQWEKEKKMERM